MPSMDMETNMTKKPNTLIINAITGEQTVREMTDAEFAQHQKDVAEGEAKKAEAEAQAAAKAALLDRLGITADEAKLLLS